ncbi:hypothetical protein MASR1M65_04700 [Saprospiraceae bacterium]
MAGVPGGFGSRPSAPGLHRAGGCGRRLASADDLIGSFAGGGLASKLSRRFGEGVVNGALTARIGIAAMELRRPLPFRDAGTAGGLVRSSRALAAMIHGAAARMPTERLCISIKWEN